MSVKEEKVKKSKELQYSEKDITFFKNDVEKIQKKPAMYIGDTASAGYIKVVFEPLDNAVDEFRAGRNSYVAIDVDTKTGIITVSDKGAGIPVGIHPQAKISTLVHIFTALQSSGKMDSKAYKHSAGTHGIGVTATNAMSEFLECWTYRKNDGGWHYVKFVNGVETTKVAKVKSAPNKEKLGTVIRFKHNNKYFSVKKFSKTELLQWCEVTSYLNAGLEIVCTIDGKRKEWKSKQGLLDYVDKQLLDMEQTNICKNVFSYKGEAEGASIEMAFAFTNADGIHLQCHTNSVLNIDKGVHYDALESVFAKCLKNYGVKLKFTPKDCMDGLVGIINFNIDDAQFSNQAKNKLVDVRVKNIAQPLIAEALTTFFAANRKFAIDWAKRASELRKKTEQFLDSKLLVKNVKAAKVKLSAKLADVSGKFAPKDCSLYCVEGDSAAGCHFGETEVLLIDGTKKSFLTLVADFSNGIDNYGLAFDRKNKVKREFKLFHPRITKYVTEYIEMELEDGTLWRGTLDHQWLLTNGKYKAAKDLTSDDEIQTIE